MAHVKKMLVEDWIAVTPNPIQRDTEKHAAKAKHLLTPHPTHSVVSAAELPSGKLVKLDGHTRAYNWEHKRVAAPVQVMVVLYPVKDMAEAEKLYKDFDSREALETMRDKVSGAFSKHNFNPNSALLQMGNIVQALRMANAVRIGGTIKMAATGGAGPEADKKSPKQKAAMSADVYDMIDEFSYELHALDGFMLRQGQITSGFMGAFFLSYRRYGHKVTPFWQGVFGNQGTKMGGQMDGIQAVAELILSQKGRGTNSRQTNYDLAARALRGVEGWLKDELFYRIPTPIDTTGYLTGHEKPTERLIKAHDKHKQGARASA